MNLVLFLRELRAMLTSPDAWHPLACANARGRILGEYEPRVPADGRLWGDVGPRRWAAIDSIPVAWNLPMAIRFLADRWESEGRFTVNVPVEKVALRYAAEGILGGFALNTMEHRVALKAIDDALAQFGEAREVA